MQGALDSIKTVISFFRWTDILDIAIVAFLIYELVLFIRNSRAQFLIKGCLIIAVTYLFARLLNLNVVAYIVELIIRNGAILIFIIFQPELRSVIERVGRSRFSFSGWFGNNKEEEERAIQLSAISSVVEAFRTLQKEHMGALVVFERSMNLDEIANTGTIVDAEASTRMLGNIFFNKAPLHDGAAIIRNGRIYAAGCILPLTQGVTPSADYGTRHRAAIGMSETSDAIVVVLSEENGLMSIAENGKITRFSNVAEFTSSLMNVIVPEDKDEDEKIISSNGKFISSIKSFFSRKKKTDDEQ